MITTININGRLDFGFDFGDLLKVGHDVEKSSLRRQC